MARIRSIKPEFWSDEKLSECSLSARLTFIGLWTFADDEGRLDYQPGRLRMQIFPCGSVSQAKLKEYLGELTERSVIRMYVVEGREYLDIPNFTKHQKINRPTPSKLPEYSLSPHGALTAHSPLEGRGRDRRGEESSGKEGKGHAPPVDNPGEASAPTDPDQSFSDQSLSLEDPQSRKNGSSKVLRVVERRNGNFEEINDTVEKLITDWQIPVTEISRLAQMAHISVPQVETAIRQLRDRGRLPVGAAA